MMSQEANNHDQIPPNNSVSNLQASYPSNSMYYINDSQNQMPSIMPVDSQMSVQSGNIDNSSMEYHCSQKVPVNQGPYREEDDETTADQKMVLESLENRPMGSVTDEVDARSVFVGNVDYGTTPPELQEHFKNCGQINRITIMIDRYTGHPKGYAYIEFQDELALPHAMALNQSMFRERPLKVVPKRKNMPGFTRGRTSLGRGSLAAVSNAFPSFIRGKIRGRSRGMMGYIPRYRGRGGRGGIYPY